MPELTLYTTAGCHLCEEAAAMLEHMQAQDQCLYVAVDIVEDPALMELYGIRIPVVRNERQQEIGWPFTLTELEQLL